MEDVKRFIISVLTYAYRCLPTLTYAYPLSTVSMPFSTAICISRKGSITCCVSLPQQHIILLNPLSAAGSVAKIRYPISPNGLLDPNLVLPSVLMSHYRAYVIAYMRSYPLLLLYRLSFLYRTSNYARSSNFLPGIGFGTTGLPFLSYIIRPPDSLYLCCLPGLLRLYRFATGAWLGG